MSKAPARGGKPRASAAVSQSGSRSSSRAGIAANSSSINSTTAAATRDEWDEDAANEYDSAAAAAERAARLERLLAQASSADAPIDDSNVDQLDQELTESNSQMPTSTSVLLSSSHADTSSHDRASLYSELHSYLDELQKKVDINDGFEDLPPTWKSALSSMQDAASQEANAQYRAAAGLPPSTSSSSSSSSTFLSQSTPPRPDSQQHQHQRIQLQHQHASPTPPTAPRTPSNAMDVESKEAAGSIAAAHASRRARGTTTPSSSSASISNAIVRSHSPPTLIPSATSPSARAKTPASNNPTASSASSSQFEEKSALDCEGYEGDDIDMEIDPNFDEMKEMEKIAALDAMLAEADQRSEELDRRLQALLAAPLGSLATDADPTLSARQNQFLLLPPTSPSSAAAGGNANASPLSPTSAAAAGIDGPTSSNDVFLTSVGGVNLEHEVPTSPNGTVQQSSNKKGTNAADAAADGGGDIWQLEEVEPLNAPLVVSLGDGFRPTAEDQHKLDEIDALLEHFRGADTKLPSAYKPRFQHPPMKKKKKKVAKKVNTASSNSASTIPSPSNSSDASTALVPVESGDMDEEDDEEEELGLTVASSSVDFDGDVARRVHALIPSNTIAVDASALGDVAVAGGSLMQLAMDNESQALEMSEEEKKEIQSFNKQLKRLQKATDKAATSNGSTAGRAGKKGATSTSNDDNPAIDSEYLRRILAKTQASLNARNGGGGGGASSSASAAAASEAFPSFNFPKDLTSNSTYNSKTSCSTDAIFEQMMKEEKKSRKAKKKGSIIGLASGLSSAVASARSDHSKASSSNSQDESERQQTEMQRAINDENEDEDDTSALDEGDEDYEEPSSGSDSDNDAPASFADGKGEEVSRDPRVRMEKLAAQIEAIRAKAFLDTEAIGEDQKEVAKKREAAQENELNHEAGGTTGIKGRAAASNSRRASGGGLSSTLPLNLSRPRSQQADLLDDGGPILPPSTPSTTRSSAPQSSFALALGERMDRAIGRPSSSSSNHSSSFGGISGSPDSWRQWQANKGGGDIDSFADMSSASRIRAAARGMQAQLSSSPSPRLGSAAALRGSPSSTNNSATGGGGGGSGQRRAISSASGLNRDGTAVPRSITPLSQTSARGSPLGHYAGPIVGSFSAGGGSRSRPASASSVHSTASSIIDLPPPISSNKLQSRLQQQNTLSKSGSGSWK